MYHLETFSTSIDHLPTEILQFVFDKLSSDDRKSASQVCHRWHQTLNADRYISRAILKVQPSTLDSEWALEGMQRPYQMIVISSEGVEKGPMWQKFRDRAQRLVKSWILRNNLRVLKVSMSAGATSQIFGQSGLICLINLETLIYTDDNRKRARGNFAVELNVHAPLLNHVRFDCFSQSSVEILKLVSPKVERLEIQFVKKAELVKALSIETFDRLRELAIHVVPGTVARRRILPEEIGETFRKNLKKLDRLSICDGMKTFRSVYEEVFSSTTNLSYLDTDDGAFLPEAFRALNHLKRLEVLQLWLRSVHHHCHCRNSLDLPELKLLMVTSGPPVEQHPGVHERSIYPSVLDESAVYLLRRFSTLPSLKMLHLRDIVLCERTLQMVCSFKSIDEIELENICGNIRVLHRLFNNNFSNLKYLTLTHCRFDAEIADRSLEEY